jgi:flagellar hook-associated protein 3 FlgL
MRVSSTWLHQQGVLQMQKQQVAMAKTQNQLASNQKWTSAADDPAGFAAAQGLDQLIAQTKQYTSSGQAALQRLQIGEDAIANGIGLLQHVRELVVQANSGSQSLESRKVIAQELAGIREQLLGIANTDDGTGRYLFAGSSDGQVPFSWSGSAVSYNGDQTAISAQIGSQRAVVQNDTGDSIFMGVATGNGTFGVSAAAGNSGSAIVGQATLTDAAAWDGGSYTLSFDGAGGYQVFDSGSNVIQSGSYSNGATISFRGAALTVGGSPAAGDSFALQPSSTQDIFALVDQLASLVAQPQASEAQRAKVQTALQQGLAGLQNAEDRMSGIRAGMGHRMNAIEDALSVAAAQNEHATTAVADLRDLDYADAISRLKLQMTALEAAQQTFVQVSGLSLFNFLR